MTGTLETDVLVVGLGPAGACAAEEAAGRGCSVIALERKTDPGTPVQCAEFVPATMGIEIDALSESTEQPIDAMVTFVEDEPGDTLERFPGLMIDRQAFDRGLVAKASEAGAACWLGTAVKAIDGDGKVALSDGRSIVPRVVIGADGPKSLIGKAIGRINREVVETRQITVALLKPHRATDIFLSVDYPGGYAWLFPKGKFANLGIGTNPDAKHLLKPLLDELHQALAAEGRVGRDIEHHTGGLIPVGGMLRPVGRLGNVAVFLAGDAAGLANPVTGAGINAAILSGRQAGQYACDLLDGDETAQADYVEELEDLFKPSLDRALRRRAELLARSKTGAPGPHDLRRNWIAYPEYWAA